MRSATDAKIFLFVNPKNVDTDKRIYSKPHFYSETGFTQTEHILVSNLRMRNGEIWGITKSSCHGHISLVKLVPCKGGMKAIEIKPYEGLYWEQ